MGAVLAQWAFPEIPLGGWAGFDVLFVICGFLTSAHLLEDLERGAFRFREFYARRVRRLFPPLLAVLSLSLLCGWSILFADEFSRLGRQVAGGALFAENLYLRAQIDHFDAKSAALPLMHLWSLGLLAQFYLVWPALVVLAVRRRWRLDALIAAIAIPSFALYLIEGRLDPRAAFYLPLPRAWEPMLGAGLAAAWAAGAVPARWREWRSIAGLGLILAGLATTAVAAGALGAALIISGGSDAWLNRRVFGAGWLTRCGRHGYPLYLWLWPVLAFAYIANDGPLPMAARVAALAAAVLLAWTSRPLMQAPIRVPALAALMGVVALAGVLADHRVLTVPVKNSDIDAMMSQPDVWRYLEDRGNSREIKPGVFELDGVPGSVTLLLGDSHVAQYSPRLGRVLARDSSASNTAIFAVSGGCVPIPGVFEDTPVHRECPHVRETALDLASRPDVKTVVIGAAWNTYFIQQTGPKVRSDDYEYYYLQDGQRYSFRSGPGAQLAMRGLERLLGTLAATKTVFLLLDNPLGHRFDPSTFLARDHMARSIAIERTDPAAAIPAAQRLLREQLLTLAARIHVRVLDPDATMCRSGRCARLMSDGVPIYLDAGHLSTTWVLRHADFMDQVLAPLRR